MPAGCGTIAGEFDGQRGPARTFTPIDVWDIRLNAGKSTTLDLHQGHNTMLVVLHGAVEVNGQEVVREGQNGAVCPRRVSGSS